MSDQYVQPNPPGGPARTTPYRDPAGTEIPKGPVPVERPSGFGAGAMVGAVFIVVAILAGVFYSSRDGDVAPVATDAVVEDPVTEAPAATTADPATNGTVSPDTVTPDAAVPEGTTPDAATGDSTGTAPAPATPPATTTQP